MSNWVVGCRDLTPVQLKSDPQCGRFWSCFYPHAHDFPLEGSLSFMSTPFGERARKYAYVCMHMPGLLAGETTRRPEKDFRRQGNWVHQLQFPAGAHCGLELWPCSAQPHIQAPRCLTQRPCSVWGGDNTWALHALEARQSRAKPEELSWGVAGHSPGGPWGSSWEQSREKRLNIDLLGSSTQSALKCLASPLTARTFALFCFTYTSTRLLR